MTNLELSEAEAAYLAEVSLHKKALTINEADSRVAMDSTNVIEKIDENGYAAHGAEIWLTQSS